MAIAPGSLVGNYKVLSRLGVGGMGTVYLAEHPIIGKKVALKVIHRELSANREVIGRFYQEARAVNLIGNEHIVEIHDFGSTPEGDPFFLMEYLDGKTLAQILSRERILDVRRALHVAAQIAVALAATHAAGIIHRDLKPDNVMVCERGGDPDFVKLLDFGLAKMAAESGAKALTAAGVILGTPQYMSPEACESKKVDHRTDIYALGVLLFQMLCGQVPFDADTMGGVLIKQVTQAPPAPRGLSPLIPPSVEQIILRCLAKAPDARFQTMAELHTALCDPDRYLGAAPATQRAAQPSAAAQQATMFAVETNAAMGYAATAGLPAYSTRAMGLANADAFGDANTVRQPLAPPPRTTAPGRAEQATMMIETAPAAPPLPAPAPNQGATMIGVMAAAPPPPEAIPRRLTSQPIAVPQNQTLILATPPGFSRHPPRRKAATVAVVVVVAAVIAIVLAVVLAGGSDPATADDAGAATGEPDAAAAVVAPVVDAGAARDAATARTASIAIASRPPGAEVKDRTGASLGRTPVTVQVPLDGQPVTFTFSRDGYVTRDKSVTPSGDMTIEVELTPDKRPGGRRGDDRGSGRGSSRPDPVDKVDQMEPTYR